MEQFVQHLYDRLEGKKDLQLQLYMIMQNAINEMHNNGIIAALAGDTAKAVHDPDPEVRVREKTSLAKAVGKQYIPVTLPVAEQGGLSYLATLNYDPRFVNSITLCFQGGIEGLYMAFAGNPGMKLNRYIIQVNANGHDLSALKHNMSQLDAMYENLAIVLMCDGTIVGLDKAQTAPAEKNVEKPVQKQEKQPEIRPEKKGFFARLLERKRPSPSAAAEKPAERVQAAAAKPQVMPSAKPEPPAVPATPMRSAVPEQTKQQRIPEQPKQQPEPVHTNGILPLSKLKTVSAAKWTDETEEMNPEQKNKLEQLAENFFMDYDRIMVQEPGNTPELRLKAIFRIGQYLEHLPQTRNKFVEKTVCTAPGCLEYNHNWLSGGTCYDGGCYSYEPDEDHYRVLRRITPDAYETQKKNRIQSPERYLRGWYYNTALPEEEQTEVFVGEKCNLYLKNPMGIFGCYEIERESR